jgi:hypothetical protein
MLKHGVLCAAYRVQQVLIANLVLSRVAIAAPMICPPVVRLLVGPSARPAPDVAQNRCFIVAIAPRPLHLALLALGKVPQRLGHKHLARFAHVFRLAGALHLLAGCLGWCLAFDVDGAACVDLAHLLPSGSVMWMPCGRYLARIVISNLLGSLQIRRALPTFSASRRGTPFSAWCSLRG